MSEPLLIDADARVVIRTPFDMRDFNLSDLGGPTTASLIDSDLGKTVAVYGLGNIAYYDELRIMGPGPMSFFPVFLGSNITESSGTITGGAVYGFAYHTGGPEWVNGIMGFVVSAVDVANAAATSDRTDDIALLRQMLAPANFVRLLTDGPLPPEGHYFFAGAGNDTVIGSSLGDTILGDAGNDLIRGGTASDRLIGGLGNDRLRGEAGADVLLGQTGADRMIGGAGNDVLKGGIGRDRLEGRLGADLLEGMSGSDTLLGGSANDRLNGGGGNDTMTGGAGADRFIYKVNSGSDVITDFEDGVDRIVIRAPADQLIEFDRFQVGSDVRLTGDEVEILLKNFNVANLTEDDFDIIAF
ncbi:calcium-binding protein [Aliigemmobacter aestuarii]|uniref:Calcium-binding protein n=1 Tax=Aliigemmobacter aestuarii TaxID=1445661 RepID=A0A4S3MJL2_9RHOB|nr:calcium-binding protein [Gemmobacter aestuarii]THD82136.1 calcium-binding protein [Gemmobacter aestuarii]